MLIIPPVSAAPGAIATRTQRNGYIRGFPDTCKTPKLRESFKTMHIGAMLRRNYRGKVDGAAPLLLRGISHHQVAVRPVRQASGEEPLCLLRFTEAKDNGAKTI